MLIQSPAQLFLSQAGQEIAQICERDPLVQRHLKRNLNPKDRKKFGNLSQEALDRLRALSAKVAFARDYKERTAAILEAYDQPSLSDFADAQFNRWGYYTRPSVDSDPKYYEPKLDTVRIGYLIGLSNRAIEAELKDIEDCIQIIKHASDYKNPGQTETGDLSQLKINNRALYDQLVLAAERILKTHKFQNAEKLSCPTPLIAIPGVSESLETELRMKLASEGRWAISSLDTAQGLANSSLDSTVITLIPMQDPKQEYSLNYLGFGRDINGFLNYVKDKVVVDLGSSGNAIAKSLYLLGSNATVINVNPSLIKPEILNDHRTKISPEYLGFSANQIPLDYDNRFKDIDTNETLFCPWSNLKPIPDASVDLVISSGALTQYACDSKELQKAINEIARILKPGGEARLTPLFYPPDKSTDRHLSLLKDFKSALRDTGVAKKFEFKEVQFNPVAKPNDRFICLVLKKK